MIEIFEEGDIPVRFDEVCSDEFLLNTVRVCIFFSKKEEKNWWFDENRVAIINDFVKEYSSFNYFKYWSMFFFNVIPRMTSAEVQRNKKRRGSLDGIYKFIHLFKQYINSKFKKYSLKTSPFKEIIL